MTATIKGNKELAAKLRQLNSFTNTRRAVQLSGLHIKGKAAQYPPASSANAPKGPGSSWYERGFGTKYMRAGGIVTGRKTSETLGRKWTVKSANRGLTTVVGNNASYGIFVQGAKQAGFHAARNWKTVETVLDEETKTIMSFILDGIRKDLA